MDTLEVCALRLISGFHQSLKSGFHQSGNAAAKNCLLAEQISLSLLAEGGLQHTCSCAADGQCVSQSQISRLACGILMNGNQTRNALALLVLASHRMSRSLWRNHGYVHILRRNNLSEMNGKAVSEHQHLALCQIRLDGLLVHVCLLLIINQNHNNVCSLGRLCCRIYLKTSCLCLGPASAALIETDNHVASGLLCVECVGMALAAVSDDGDCLSLQHG